MVDRATGLEDVEGVVDGGSEGVVGDGGADPDELVAGFATGGPCAAEEEGD